MKRKPSYQSRRIESYTHHSVITRNSAWRLEIFFHVEEKNSDLLSNLHTSQVSINVELVRPRRYGLIIQNVQPTWSTSLSMRKIRTVISRQPISKPFSASSWWLFISNWCLVLNRHSAWCKFHPVYVCGFFYSEIHEIINGVGDVGGFLVGWLWNWWWWPWTQQCHLTIKTVESNNNEVYIRTTTNHGFRLWNNHSPSSVLKSNRIIWFREGGLDSFCQRGYKNDIDCLFFHHIRP